MKQTELSISVQKALHLYIEEEKKAPKHLGHEYAIFEKYDGWYMYVDFVNGAWQGIRSKTGRQLYSMDWYNELLEKGPKPNQNLRIIFEAVIPGMIFKDANGRFNQSKERLTNVVCWAHDILFEKYPHTIFSKRYDRLVSVIKYLDYSWLRLAPILAVTSDTKAWYEHYERIISTRDQFGHTGEGIIAKKWDEPYHEGKRDFSLMKIKCELTLDMEIIGWGKGKPGSKYENTLGYLVVREKSGQTHQVSGMDDWQRDAWARDFNLVRGAVAEIDAMKRLPNGSLREARFKAIRHDKTVADID